LASLNTPAASVAAQPIRQAFREKDLERHLAGFDVRPDPFLLFRSELIISSGTVGHERFLAWRW
jgi:hypothetical protein